MHNRQRHSPSCTPHRQRAKRQRQYRIHESLRPGAKQSAAAVDCIDPWNVPWPLHLFVPFFSPLFVGKRPSPAFTAILTHACIIPCSFPFKPPSTSSCPSLSPSATVVPAPLQGPQKNHSDLISRISVFPPFQRGLRPTPLFMVLPPTFSYCDYET